MENKKTTILNKIYLIILCLNIVLLNIFVGSTHQQPKLILETIIIAEALIYIIASKILKQKQILIKGKIDIVVAVFIVSTFLPLIFKTYASLNGTVKMCLHYITIYSMYILVRNVITTSKRKTIFINTALISSVIIVIFGIDKLYFNVCAPFLKFIDSAQSDAYGMVSTIGYSNAVFAYFAFLIMVCIGCFFENESKKITLKSMYVVYMQLAMYAFYYGKSRAGMIFFAMFFIIYLAKLKSIKKILQSVFIILITYVLVVIFDRCKGLYTNNTYVCIAVCISLIISYMVSILYNMCINIISKRIKNIKTLAFENKKITIYKCLICIILLFALAIAYIMCAKNYSKPTKIAVNTRVTLWANNVIKANNTYSIKINYMAKINSEPVEIKITEKDKYRDGREIGSITISESDTNGYKEIQVTNSDIELDRVHVKFSVPEDSEFTLNKIYINNKEYVTNYKYIPNDIMRMIKTINFNNVCVAERFSMYRSGLQLVPKHIFIGNGGRTYENLYRTVREYRYNTLELHSIWLDILVDYGLCGFLTFCSIVGVAIYNFIKRTNKKSVLEMSIFMGFGFVLVHMVFDFDLAYLVTACNLFMYIAIISQEDRNLKFKYDKILDWLVMALFTGIVIFNCFGIYGQQLYKQKKYAEAIWYLPYSEEARYKYLMDNKEEKDLLSLQKCLIQYLNNEKNKKQFSILKQLFENSNSLSEQGYQKEAIEGYKTIHRIIVDDEFESKYEVGEIYNKGIFYKSYIKKMNNINRFYNDDNLDAKPIIEKFEREYDKNVEQMKDTKKNGNSASYIEYILKKYKKIYDEITNAK